MSPKNKSKSSKPPKPPTAVVSARVDAATCKELHRLCRVSKHKNLSETVATAIMAYIKTRNGK